MGLDLDAKMGCKVPQITVIFWIIKCCATTVGETLSDTFNSNLGFGLGGCAAFFFPLLVINLIYQFRRSTYHPVPYWLAVVLMSICGTICTDGLHDNLGVELWIEIIIFFVLMVATFGWWYHSEKTIDIHSIDTTRREMFYWLTIIFTFALGTAVGDFISEASQFGYGPTVGLFAGALACIFAIWKLHLVDSVTGFWLAYIMTRPLGAAVGDLLSSPTNTQAAGLGYGITSVIFTVLIVAGVAYLVYSKVDQILDGSHGVIPQQDENGSSKKSNAGEGVELVHEHIAV